MSKLSIYWHKVKMKLTSTFVNMFAGQTNDDLDNTVLIIGSARSGTTFLMESLNNKNDYRIIFEPFNPTYTKEWSALSARQYFDPAKASETEIQIIEGILRGEIKNRWVDRYNKKMKSSKRLIKCVRANLLLDLIEERFKEVTVIYLFRNPYDVVASRLNLNFDPKDVHLILEHDDFISKYYSDIDLENLHEVLTGKAYCHAAMWCLENRFILQSLGTRNILVAKYEDIKRKTVELSKGKLLVSDLARKPSLTSSLHGSYQLSNEETENVTAILEMFKMNEFAIHK